MEKRALTLDVLANFFLQEVMLSNLAENPAELANGYLAKIGDTQLDWEFANRKYEFLSQRSFIAKAAARHGVIYPAELISPEIDGSNHELIQDTLRKVFTTFALMPEKVQKTMIISWLKYVKD